MKQPGESRMDAEISEGMDSEIDDGLPTRDDENDTYRSILRIAVPALGAILSDPLMSLIDTACVGQIGSLQLAALGPNVSIFNFLFQVFTFLSAATCNFVAGNSAVSKTWKEKKLREFNASRFFSQGILFSFFMGVFTATFIEIFGIQLLFAMGAKSSFAESAISYLRIRSLSIPVVLVMVVCQGACLGLQDAKTPMLIYLVAAFINSLGDGILTLWLSWGVTGAALATLVAQVVGCILFITYFLRKNHISNRLNNSQTTSVVIESEDQSSMNQPLFFLNEPKNETIPLLLDYEIEVLEGVQNESKAHFDDNIDYDTTKHTFNLKLGWFGFPDRKTLKPYMDMAFPLILRSFLGMALYTILTKVASNLGVLQLASHQVALQLFWTISYIPEPLSISAQSLIARGMIENPQGVRQIARKLVVISLLLGILLALGVFCITFFGNALLTSDPEVTNMILSVLPQSMLSQIICSVSITLEGIGIGSGKYSYFPYLQFFVLSVSWIFLALSQRMGLGFSGIWWTLVCFLFTRTLGHIIYIRVHWKNHVLGGTKLGFLY